MTAGSDTGSRLLSAAHDCYVAANAVREHQYQVADDAIAAAIHLLREPGPDSPLFRASLPLTEIPVAGEWLGLEAGEEERIIDQILAVGRTCIDAAVPRVEG